MPRLPNMLMEALTEADEWHVKAGGKHWKLYVNGHFAGILPVGKKQSTDLRAQINTRAQIRNILRLTA
jgi:hypothetical protein